MDNRLIESKQMMPLNAAKIVRMAVARITYEDDEFRTYSCSITELADFLRVTKSNLYHDIRWMCDVLERSCVFVSTDDPQKPWNRLQWIDNANYDGKGTLTLQLSKDVESPRSTSIFWMKKRAWMESTTPLPSATLFTGRLGLRCLRRIW